MGVGPSLLSKLTKARTHLYEMNSVRLLIDYYYYYRITWLVHTSRSYYCLLTWRGFSKKETKDTNLNVIFVIGNPANKKNHKVSCLRTKELQVQWIKAYQCKNYCCFFLVQTTL